MYKNLDFKYTTFEANDGKIYADSVFFYFTFDKKYLKEKNYNGYISFEYGYICDIYFTTNYAELTNNINTDILSYYLLDKTDILETKDNYHFILKVGIKELKLPEVNYAFFKASRGDLFYETPGNKLPPKEVWKYLGTINLKIFYEYVDKIKGY